MKKAKITLKFEASFDPAIHPEDLVRAILMKAKPSGPDVERFGEDLILDCIANTKQLDERQVQEIVRRSKSKDFVEKWARAMQRGRQPAFSSEELYVLRNWRKVAFDGPDGLPQDQPGLWEWRSGAAAYLLRGLKVQPNASASSFEELRKRLGLVPRARKRVLRFIAPEGIEKAKIEIID